MLKHFFNIPFPFFYKKICHRLLNYILSITRFYKLGVSMVCIDFRWNRRRWVLKKGGIDDIENVDKAVSNYVDIIEKVE